LAISISVEEAGDGEDRRPSGRNAPVENEKYARKENRNGNDQLRGRDIDGCNMRSDTACHCHQKKERSCKAQSADAYRNAKSDQKCQMVWTNDRMTETGCNTFSKSRRYLPAHQVMRRGGAGSTE